MPCKKAGEYREEVEAQLLKLKFRTSIGRFLGGGISFL